MSQGLCGVTITKTHWLRGIKAYGGPPKAMFLVQTWWPLTDLTPGWFGR